MWRPERHGKSLMTPFQKYDGIQRPIHPDRLRCSSFKTFPLFAVLPPCLTGASASSVGHRTCRIEYEVLAHATLSQGPLRVNKPRYSKRIHRRVRQRAVTNAVDPHILPCLDTGRVPANVQATSKVVSWHETPRPIENAVRSGPCIFIGMLFVTCVWVRFLQAGG